MRWLVMMALLAACQEKQTDNHAAESCDQGHAADCMAATAGMDYTNPAQLRKAMGYCRKGCRLENAASCAQLGTVAEFGMESGGKAPDRVRAIQYYDLACQYGDAKSCERAGHPVVATPDATPR